MTQPTGISLGESSVLDTKSATIIIIPPIIAERKTTYLCFDEKSFLTICGAIKSTNPITPAKATAAPVNAELKINKIHLTFFVSTPIALACSSPKVRMSSSFEKNRKAATQTINIIARTVIYSQLFAENEPSCHFIIMYILSFEKVESSVKMALIKSERTIPHRTIVVLSKFLSTFDAKPTQRITVKRPKIRPTSGSVNVFKNGRVIPVTKIIPTPSDAPLETPSVYGDANGLRRTDWITAPLAEIDAPTRKAIITRGSRNSQIVVIVIFENSSEMSVPKILCPKTRSTSGNEMLLLPAETPIIIITNASKGRRIIAALACELLVEKLWMDRFCNFNYSFRNVL